MASKTLHLHLRDLNPWLIKAWEKHFEDCENVTISHGDIFDGTSTDALVSPANSFGFMDGGIDLVYSDHLGWRLSEVLREEIATKYDGELLVGQAIAISIPPTLPVDKRKDLKFKYLISAPTMRVPMDVSQTANAYLAFRAAIRKALSAPDITSILCPGLGTAVGQMGPDICAKQMRIAWDEMGKAPRYPTLALAFRQHLELLPTSFDKELWNGLGLING